MKMAKKFLAVALAGVLALSVLTGCGKDSVTTKTVAKALSDVLPYTITDSKALTDLAGGSVKTAIDGIVNPTAQTLSEAEAVTYENALAQEGADETLAAVAGIKALTDADKQVKIILVKVKNTDLSTEVAVLSNLVDADEDDSDSVLVLTKDESDKTFEDCNGAEIGTKTFKSGSDNYLLAVVTFDADAE